MIAIDKSFPWPASGRFKWVGWVGVVAPRQGTQTWWKSEVYPTLIVAGGTSIRELLATCDFNVIQAHPFGINMAAMESDHTEELLERLSNGESIPQYDTVRLA